MAINWRDRLSFLSDFLEVFPYISSGAALIVSLLTTTTGITLSSLKIFPWAIAFIGLGIIGIIVYLLASKRRTQLSILRNRDIIIDQDDLDIHVNKNGRFIERRVTLRALRHVEAYRFKFYWTGSSEDNKVICRDTDGYIAQTYPLLGGHLQWRPYELRFHEPMKANEIKTITLRYTMRDPRQRALPYHSFSYAHVHGCKKLVARLYFADEVKPDVVYLSHLDENDTPKLRRVLAFDIKLQAYEINENPKAGQKFSVEWEWTGEKSIQREDSSEAEKFIATIQGFDSAN